MSDSESEDQEMKAANKVAIFIKPSDRNIPELTFVVRLNDVFEKIRKAHAKNLKRDLDTFIYMYNGKILKNSITPKMLEMLPGRRYELDAAIHQEGGRRK